MLIFNGGEKLSLASRLRYYRIEGTGFLSFCGRPLHYAGGRVSSAPLCLRSGSELHSGRLSDDNGCCALCGGDRNEPGPGSEWIATQKRGMRQKAVLSAFCTHPRFFMHSCFLTFPCRQSAQHFPLSFSKIASTAAQAGQSQYFFPAAFSSSPCFATPSAASAPPNHAGSRLRPGKCDQLLQGHNVCLKLRHISCGLLFFPVCSRSVQPGLSGFLSPLCCRKKQPSALSFFLSHSFLSLLSCWFLLPEYFLRGCRPIL